MEHALSILINFYVNDKFVQTISSLMSNGLPHFINFIPIGIIKEAEFSEKAKMLALELLQHLDRDPTFLGNLVAFPEVLKDFKDMKNSGWDLKQCELVLSRETPSSIWPALYVRSSPSLGGRLVSPATIRQCSYNGVSSYFVLLQSYMYTIFYLVYGENKKTGLGPWL